MLNEKLLDTLSADIAFNREAAEKYNGLLLSSAVGVESKCMDQSTSKYVKDMAKYYLEQAKRARDLLLSLAAPAGAVVEEVQAELDLAVAPKKKASPQLSTPVVDYPSKEAVEDTFGDTLADDLPLTED
jgi:predicted Zn-dependent protease